MTLIPMQAMNRYQPDDIDLYRIKSAESDQDKISALEDAINKAVDKAQMNYLWVSLSVAVALLMLYQSFSALGQNPIPSEVFRWCIIVMTILVVLPWQLRKMRPIG